MTLHSHDQPTNLDRQRIDELSGRILENAGQKVGQRFMVAIAGGPAAGKSTLASKIVDTINQLSAVSRAVYVPMDGFHKKAAVLEHEGTTDLKGRPETFEVARLFTFLELVKRFDRNVMAPHYSRAIHDVIEDAYQIDQQDIAIVEGNYLLLNSGLWRDISKLFDLKIFLEVSQETAVRRLHQRYCDSGRSPQWQERHIDSVDVPNLQLVATSRSQANYIISAE